jgi:hypothetical protein
MHQLKNNKSFSKPQLAIFVIAFALIGYLIFRSFAAPNPALPGDLNNDNTVNITDMSILLSNYNTSNATADINGDGTVNVLDLSILLSHYGQSITTNTNLSPSTTSHNIDGNLSESDWNISTQVTKCVIGTCNNTVTYGTLWDNSYLYVGIKVLDSSLKNDGPNCWDDDSVEVYIDPTNAGGTTYTANDRQIVQRYNDTGLCAGVGSNTGTLHAWAAITGGYSVELAIPWSLLGTTASSGKTIGFDVGVNDDDDGTTRDSQLMWSGTASNSTNPSGFGKLTLNGTPTGGAPTGGGSGTPPPTGQVYGYDTHVIWQSDRSNYVQLAANGGAKSIRDDFTWGAIEPSLNSYNWSEPDTIVTLAANAGMSVLADAAYGPGWATVSGDFNVKSAPTNNQYYADFVKQVALRYGKNGTFWSSHPTVPKIPLAGIEIWNEQNTRGFWQNPNAATYTAMLKAAYTAIKSADSSIMVISGGLAPQGGYNDGDCNGTADGGVAANGINGINFLQQMYQNGAAGYMDAVGFHPYNWSGGTAAKWFTYHLCSAWSDTNDTPVSIRSVMTQNGDGNKKVWATEIGAPTDTGHFTESEQANLASQLIPKWKSYSWAGNFYWYDLRDDGTDITYTEDNFGTVRTNSTLKPSYSALKSAW